MDNDPSRWPGAEVSRAAAAVDPGVLPTKDASFCPGAESVGAAAAAAEAGHHGEHPSIYSLYSPLRRNLIVLAVSITSLPALGSSLYLPVLEMVKSELQIGQALLAATAAINLVVLGLSSLVSGPASDRFGRAPVYSFTCLGFIGSSLGCMFAPNITVLLACRALQAVTASALAVTGYGVIADVVPPRIRGIATGVMTLVAGLGMVAAPLVGGVLAQSLGWRSTFAALAIMCGLAAMLLLVCMRRETHSTMRLEKIDPDAAYAMEEWEAGIATPPQFVTPWTPIMEILKPDIAPHALLGIVTWAVFSSLSNEALPTALAENYHLSAEMVGVSLLADGVLAIAATPLGGWLSDRSAAKGKAAVSRIAPNTWVQPSCDGTWSSREHMCSVGNTLPCPCCDRASHGWHCNFWGALLLPSTVQLHVNCQAVCSCHTNSRCSEHYVCECRCCGCCGCDSPELAGVWVVADNVGAAPGVSWCFCWCGDLSAAG